MNGKQFLDAMEGIQDRYILSAQACLGYIPEQRKRRTLSVKRIFTVALAAVLAVLCTVAAAMAVSPEFREAIISLFQIGEVEQVPEVPADGYEVKQVTIGDEVSAQYVKVEGIWSAENGTLLMQSESIPEEPYYRIHYYDLIDGRLVEVGMEPTHLATRLNWYGRDIDIHLRFFNYKDRLYLYNGCGGSCYEDTMTFSVTAECLGTRTDVVVLRGECYGSEADTNWAWVCDLKTGQVQNVLAGCGIENFTRIEQVYLTEDLKHALVRAWDGTFGSGETPYLVNLEEKSCTPLSELMGLDIPTAFGSYEVTFYDSDTVLLAMAPLWRPEPTSAWTYHIPSGAVTPTVVQEDELTAIDTEAAYDWSLSQQVDGEGTVTILDLRTGSRVRLEGITAQGRCYLKANPSKTKLLWVDWGESNLNRLGVIDLENGEFTAFERAGMELQYNERVFWMDDNRVAAIMDLHTGEPYGSYPTNEYYLCVYEF